MQCVTSWNNEKGEIIGDIIRVFKDSEGYWDFEPVTDENDYWNMKSNSEVSNFEEFSNAQDYITFKEYRDGNYGEINIDYSYCAPVVNENGFEDNNLINQNFMPTYLGESSTPMYMPYGDVIMPNVISPLIPVPIFIGGCLIGWHRNNLFFGRRFMPGFMGGSFIRRGLWNSMNYALRTRRYGSPMGPMYMSSHFGSLRNRLPPIGFSTDSRMNGRWNRFGNRGGGRNGSGRWNRFGGRGFKTREHNKFNNRRPGGQGRPGFTRPGGQGRPGSIRPGGQGRPGFTRPGGQGRPGSIRPGGQGRPGSIRPGGQGRPGSTRPGGQGRPGSIRPGGQGRPGSTRPGGQGRPGFTRPGGQGRPGSTRPGGQGRPGSTRPNNNFNQNNNNPNRGNNNPWMNNQRPPNRFGNQQNMPNRFSLPRNNPMFNNIRQNFLSQNQWRGFQNSRFDGRNNRAPVRNQQRPNFFNGFNMRPTQNRNTNQGWPNFNRQNFNRPNFSRPSFNRPSFSGRNNSPGSGRGPSSRGSRGGKKG